MALGFLKKVFSFGKKEVVEAPVGTADLRTDNDGLEPLDQAALQDMARAQEVARAATEAQQAAEASARRDAEEKAAAEAAMKAAAEAERQVEQERRAAEEAAALKAAEEAARRQAEEEAQRVAEQKAAAEAATKAVAEAERQAEQERRAAEEAATLKAAEEAARRQAEEEAQRVAEQKAAAEAATKAVAEAERQAEQERRAAEEAATLKAAEETARRQAEDEARRVAEEAVARAEAEARQAAEQKVAAEAAAEAERHAEQERRAAEEAAALKAAEEEARRQAEEEARRVAEEAVARAEAEARQAAEQKVAAEAAAEAERQVEQERRAAEEAAALKAAEEAARRQAEEEARRAAGKVTVAKKVEQKADPQPAAPPPAPRQSWFQRLTQGLARSSRELTGNVAGLFTKRRLDEDTLQDLEDVLIRADLGVETALRITDALSSGRYGKNVSDEEVRSVMAEEIGKVLTPVAMPLELDLSHKPHVILVVGVNGTGKTTTIGKLAAKLTDGGLSVMLAAGDTFRAAAIEQLKIWGERTRSPVVSSKLGADAAGLAYDAFEQAKAAGSDVLIIDTAGRLQNKTELMAELEKIVRVLGKLDPEAPHTVLQTVDATTGQNALNQVEIFRNIAGVNGLVMTKLDGTARGGILVGIAAKYKLPVYFIGVGEQVDDLEPFSASDFAKAIAGIG